MNVMDLLNLYPAYPPLLNMIFSINTYVMITLFLYFGYRKIKMIGAMRTMVFWKDGNQTIKNYLIKDDRLQIRKGGLLNSAREWCPKVTPEMVLPHKRSFQNMAIPWGFKQKDMLIAVEDSEECVILRGIKSGEGIIELDEKVASILMKSWTKEEVKIWLNKAVAKASVERKLFSDTQFYIFAFVVVMNLIFTFMIARRMGIM